MLLSASASRGVTTGRKSWEGAPWGEGAVPAPPPSAAPAVCGRRIVAPGDEGPAAEAEAGAGAFSWPEAAGAIVAKAGVDMGSGKRAGLRRGDGDGDADADADAVSEGGEGGVRLHLLGYGIFGGSRQLTDAGVLRDGDVRDRIGPGQQMDAWSGPSPSCGWGFGGGCGGARGGMRQMAGWRAGGMLPCLSEGENDVGGAAASRLVLLD